MTKSSSMKKICFVIPYFGKFNNYFPLFLESCKNNPTIDWLIFTDDETEYNYPENVNVEYTTFEAIRDSFRKKLGFKIALNRPYKLCDFRPAYGYLFEKDLKKYDFWGYCDTDLIFGDIRKFFTDKILDKYDLIGYYGHCTIIRNDNKANRMFECTERYKEVFKNEQNCGFDEGLNDESINDIFLDNKMRCLFHSYHADLSCNSSVFRLVQYNFKTKNRFVEDRQKAFFVYNHGRLLRYYTDINKVDEHLYIHMLKRPMKVRTENLDFYKIIPNSFDEFSQEELDDAKNVKIRHFNLQRFRDKKRRMIGGVKKRFIT